MKCSVKYCNHTAKHFYKLGEVKFGYCDKHEIIPKKQIKSIKAGYWCRR